MAMNNGLPKHPLLFAALLAVTMAGCTLTAEDPDYGRSGFDALGGLGQRLTDIILEKANRHGLYSPLHMDEDSPIQMTKFVNMDGSTTGNRFGSLMAEHMAQRFAERGYLVTRAMPAEKVFQATFPEDANIDEPSKHNAH